MLEQQEDNDFMQQDLSGRLGGIVSSRVKSELTDEVTGKQLPRPSLSFGFEVSTSAHAFQIFFTNYQEILSQKNSAFNTNDFKEGQFLIGFNITRLWNL